METKNKRCHCCNTEVPIDTLICPKCGATLSQPLNQKEYETRKKGEKIVISIGVTVGIVTTSILGAISPNSYLFLIGIALGFIALFISAAIWDKHYKNDSLEKNKKLKQKNEQKALNEVKKELGKCGVHFFLKYFESLNQPLLRDIVVEEVYTPEEKLERLQAAKKIISSDILTVTALNYIITTYANYLSETEMNKAKQYLGKYSCEQT